MSFANFIRFVCYKDDKQLAEFVAMPDMIIDSSGHWFAYGKYLASTQFIPPQIEGMVVRARCSHNLYDLFLELWMYCGYSTPNVALPCDRWCDVLLDGGKEDRALVMRDLTHHSADGTKCHYAMNANWAPDAPSDMVLLFETGGGWNQCGGPELFSFDNHSPRGGCVMLNDGSWDDPGKEPTVLFIRTEEELKQLRWK
ncbi:MAG: hypothetical protein KBE65_01740 [Phycisphaerae bacterium]|nr:hypothetical protein [Phycisphaerae bacterium]